MKHEKSVIYDSCDFCDRTMEAVGQCDICDKYYCPKHGQRYLIAGQVYHFCNEHYEQAIAILESTGIPLGFIERKLRSGELPEFLLDTWNKRGYEKKWNDYMDVKRNG